MSSKVRGGKRRVKGGNSAGAAPYADAVYGAAGQQQAASVNTNTIKMNQVGGNAPMESASVLSPTSYSGGKRRKRSCKSNISLAAAAIPALILNALNRGRKSMSRSTRRSKRHSKRSRSRRR